MAGVGEEKGAPVLPNVDTSRADRDIWMLKVPNAVALQWKQPRPMLGKLVISVDPRCPSDPGSTQFTLDVASKEPEGAAKGYELNVAKDEVPMHIFAETPQGKISVEGNVAYKFDMKPTSLGDDEYRKLCRERMNKSLIKTRTVQRLDNDRGSFMRPMPVATWPTGGGKDKKRIIPPPKQPEGKRIRRERAELEEDVFKLFERQSNWTLKQLVQETDQPQAFLKEVLNDLCIYNKRGANQGTYELKPEYKRTNATDESKPDVKEPPGKT